MDFYEILAYWISLENTWANQNQMYKTLLVQNCVPRLNVPIYWKVNEEKIPYSMLKTCYQRKIKL